jgi:hypothetical protein
MPEFYDFIALMLIWNLRWWSIIVSAKMLTLEIHFWDEGREVKSEDWDVDLTTCTNLSAELLMSIFLQEW